MEIDETREIYGIHFVPYDDDGYRSFRVGDVFDEHGYRPYTIASIITNHQLMVHDKVRVFIMLLDEDGINRCMIYPRHITAIHGKPPVVN